MNKHPTRTRVLSMAKEIKETSDNKLAADLLTSGNWIAVSATIRKGVIGWILIRII